MQLTPGKLWGMRRMADENGLFKMTAVDQRPPIKNPIAKHPPMIIDSSSQMLILSAGLLTLGVNSYSISASLFP